MFDRRFHISYLLKPSSALLVCLSIICIAVFVGVCSEAIGGICDSSVVIAIVTGLITSSVVAALLQTGDNYKANTERSGDLFDFFVALKLYEHLIADHIKSNQRREEPFESYDDYRGTLSAIWHELGGIITLLRKNKDNKQRVLTLA